MTFTLIRKNTYQDSINLMLLTNRINQLPGVVRSSIMMGTPANKDLYRAGGLYNEKLDEACANDMMIVAEVEEESCWQCVLDEADRFLSDLSGGGRQEKETAKTWDQALEQLPDANLALFSIPGEYAPVELETALRRGLHVFSFTDNISLEDEVRLKKYAHEKGLLLMGPDCGTGILSGMPVAFTNAVKTGTIGIVGASGTGIQEVSSIIDRMGGGVTHAIGTGGRDLSEEVGAITMKDALAALEHHSATKVITVISKPPAPRVRNEVVTMLSNMTKPVVAVFLGEKPEAHSDGIYIAHTLEEAAAASVAYSRGEDPFAAALPAAMESELRLPANGTVKALYSGGTLAAEAAMLITEALDLGHLTKEHGYMLRSRGFEVVDLGDDCYTQGRPHPMIDPGVRVEMLRKVLDDPDTAVVLLDCMLGYGCHENMAGVLSEEIQALLMKAELAGRPFAVVCTVCGTAGDPQSYAQAVSVLKESGAIVADTNAQAVLTALKLLGHNRPEKQRPVVPFAGAKTAIPRPDEKIMSLVEGAPRIINVGVRSFLNSIEDYKGTAVQFDWQPIAGGNKEMIALLHRLEQHPEIDVLNQAVVQRLKDGQPFLIDVVQASSAIEQLKGKTLLHAGPPIRYEDMTGPMQGACVGATLFEEWAETEEEARAMLERGEISFMPCHYAHAVGPMGGITSGHMPLLKVENRVDGTLAYCTMNEGIGKVLRFGAYSEEVVNRLRWMRDVLGPVLGAAVRSTPNGINLNVIIAKAITMGDEFHQRNIAASLNFFKEITPYILELGCSEEETRQVVRFLADTDQFFLNVMMAAGKSIVDSARKVEEGCVVTTMCRNGREFGIRISGLGDQWFTAPVNLPQGMYFTGYCAEDGNPDIGDSAITETVGVGGMAMVAAPGITRFVGAGGFADAQRISNEMEQICVGHNSTFAVPTWDFKGVPLGIDIRKVVRTGITPLINTGIAHKEAGVGQIGAGTVRAPLACFEKALRAYAEKYCEGEE